MVENDSSFEVGYGDVKILRVLSSESTFVKVNMCTKTFYLDSIPIFFCDM